MKLSEEEWKVEFHRVIKTVEEVRQINSQLWDWRDYWNAATVSLCLGYKEASSSLFQRAMDSLRDGPKKNWDSLDKEEQGENIQMCGWYQDYSQNRKLPWKEELALLDKETINWKQAWALRCRGVEVLDDLRYLEDKEAGRFGNDVLYQTWHLNTIGSIARGGQCIDYSVLIPEYPESLTTRAKKWFDHYREAKEKNEDVGSNTALIQEMHGIKLDFLKAALKSLKIFSDHFKTIRLNDVLQYKIGQDEYHEDYGLEATVVIVREPSMTDVVVRVIKIHFKGQQVSIAEGEEILAESHQLYP